MALSNLRPGITVRQERITAFPNVQQSILPAVLVGINRDLQFQQLADLEDWSAGSAVNGVAFPGYTSGRVEAGVDEPHLKPRFFIQNTLGLAEITDRVTLNNIGSGATGAPTFDISSGFSATFDITSGTDGCFAVDNTTETLSAFKAPSADFIFSQVRRGDKILVDDVETYEVTGIVSDAELDVRRIGKGPESIGETEASKLQLTVEDSNDFRRLISRSDSFNAAGGFGPDGTKVKSGDLLKVDNWSIKSASGGLIFSALGEDEDLVVTATPNHTVLADERVLMFPLSTTMGDEAFNTATGEGSVVFTLGGQDGLTPSMYLTSGYDATRQAAAKTFDVSPLLAQDDSDFGVAYSAYRYSNLVTAIASTTGAFGAADAVTGIRSFTDTNANPALFDALNLTVTATQKVHILVKDADGVYVPMFDVTASPTASELLVKEFEGIDLATTDVANNVEFVVMTVDISDPTFYSAGGGATVTTTFAEDTGDPLFVAYADADYTYDLTQSPQPSYTLTAEDRILDTGAGTDFTALPPVEPGEYIFNDAGILMFQVIAVPRTDPVGAVTDKLVVRVARNAGTQLQGTDALSNFGFTVRDNGLRADFVVRRVVSPTELEVSAAPDSPNQIVGTQSVQGMIWFQDFTSTSPVLATSVVARDNAENLPYTIQKTLSGSALEGDILVNYATIRDDLIGIQELQADTYASVLGDDTPDNPLGLAARIYFSNSSQSVRVVQVKDDTQAAWIAAAEAVKTDVVYNIVPLTSDETILSMWRAHVKEQSLPENKRERVLWQSTRFLRDQVRAEYEVGESALVTRTSDGDQTLVIGKDLLALGVLIGDDFSGTWFNGATTQEFSGRILDTSLAGSTTTLTILPDGNVPLSTTDMVVSGYQITQRPMSPAEIKDEVAAYPAAIADRRVRNIYPDRCQIQYSDDSGDGETTGFYGGGVQVVDADGFYMCVTQVALRINLGPALPLSRRDSAGIYQVLDTFAEQPDFQDTIIDAGNYYMEQPGGIGSDVQAIRALSTDVSELVTAEESVTSQIDSFARKLRLNLTPLLGPHLMDENFFSMVSTLSQAVVARVLKDRELREIELLGIKESPDSADTFLMDYEVVPYFSGARSIVTIYF